MFANIKSEKSTNEFKDPILCNVSVSVYNKLCADHENLKLMLSLKNKRCEEHVQTINELNSKVQDQSRIIKNFQDQLDLMKTKENSNMKMVNLHEIHNKEMYTIISSFRIDSKSVEVTDPKAAVIRINEAQLKMKRLNDHINENRILLLTLCRMLSCEDVTIIQSIKDILRENDILKKKSQELQHFFERSMEFTNGLCNDLHRTGVMSNPVKVGVVLDYHENGIADFEKRMTNTRHIYLSKTQNNPISLPTFETHNNVPRMNMDSNHSSRWNSTNPSICSSLSSSNNGNKSYRKRVRTKRITDDERYKYVHDNTPVRKYPSRQI